jgi:hypothetical protein
MGGERVTLGRTCRVESMLGKKCRCIAKSKGVIPVREPVPPYATACLRGPEVPCGAGLGGFDGVIRVAKGQSGGRLEQSGPRGAVYLIGFPPKPP